MNSKIKISLLLSVLILLIGHGFSQNVVEKIEFFGNERIDDDQLETWSGIKEGSAINMNIINSANQKIITGYQESGYLFARIDSTILDSEDNPNRPSIQWYINEGTLVRLGKVHMSADSLSMDEIENLVDFNEGDIYRREYIILGILILILKLIPAPE
jgi:outer membrane protein assembly factor BamA